MHDLAELSNKKRKARLRAIRNACRDYISGRLHEFLSAQLSSVTDEEAYTEIDANDPDGQTVLIHYPAVASSEGIYVRPAVRVECGAKSALSPHRPVSVRPYVADNASRFELTVHDVSTIEPGRTFWDKILILYELRRWYERHGILRQGGQRVSRHYYDVHCLSGSTPGKAALDDIALGIDCAQHARMFFGRPGSHLASAASGPFAITPTEGMARVLRRDYDNTTGMIFGAPPAL